MTFNIIFNIWQYWLNEIKWKILTIALILWQLGYRLRTLKTLSQVTGFPNYRVSINQGNLVVIWRYLWCDFKNLTIFTIFSTESFGSVFSKRGIDMIKNKTDTKTQKPDSGKILENIIIFSLKIVPYASKMYWNTEDYFKTCSHSKVKKLMLWHRGCQPFTWRAKIFFKSKWQVNNSPPSKIYNYNNLAKNNSHSITICLWELRSGPGLDGRVLDFHRIQSKS